MRTYARVSAVGAGTRPAVVGEFARTPRYQEASSSPGEAITNRHCALDELRTGILGDEERLAVIGNFPLSTVPAFPGLGLERAVLASLLDRMETA